MIRRKGWFERQAIMLGSTPGAIAEMASGMWKSPSGRRWLVPLAIFLCLTGLLLIVAGSVQALAPFIYAIF